MSVAQCYSVSAVAEISQARTRCKQRHKLLSRRYFHCDKIIFSL